MRRRACGRPLEAGVLGFGLSEPKMPSRKEDMIAVVACVLLVLSKKEELGGELGENASALWKRVID